MSFLISLSKRIDTLNEKIGHAVSWALLAAVLICSGNALIRYTFNMSSNAGSKSSGICSAAIFLLATAYTLRRNEHVRIDVVAGRFSKRTQVWIDLFGFLLFLLPMTLIILYYARALRVHIVPESGIIEQCRRPDRMAGQNVDPARLFSADAARHFRIHQAHRLPDGQSRRAANSRSMSPRRKKKSKRSKPPTS